MPTHIALLRGVNVGGGNKVPMAELRTVVTALGHREVATYIQSGNIVYSPTSDDPLALAQELEAAIAASFGVHCRVIVLSRDELAQVITANPYADEPVLKFVHAVFLPADPDEAAHAFVADTLARVRGASGRDEAVIVGRTLYLHTPDGFGTSVLAKELLVTRRGNPLTAGTARNWATTTKLLELCGG